MHLLCATHTLAPLVVLSAQMPTLVAFGRATLAEDSVHVGAIGLALHWSHWPGRFVDRRGKCLFVCSPQTARAFESCEKKWQGASTKQGGVRVA